MPRGRKARTSEEMRLQVGNPACEDRGGTGAVVDALPVGVWQIDVNGRVLSCNPAARRIWGEACIEACGDFRGRWHDCGRPLETHEWAGARALSNGEPCLDQIVDIQGPDGLRKTIRDSATPLCDGERITGAVILHEDITEQIRAEDERRQLLDMLRERVKELSLVENVSRLLQRSDLAPDQLLREILSRIPAGWQHPEVVAARIAVADLEVCTPGFQRTAHCQRAAFRTKGGAAGEIEVLYREARPAVSEEGPFLPEERRLIETLAEMLRMHFDALEAEAAGNRAVRTQAAILDSLPATIVLLDCDGTILAANRAWKEFAAARGIGEQTCGIGGNYLSLCEHPDRGFPLSRRAAQRIPDVLARRIDRLERDYSCQVDGQRRWFRLIAAPVHDGTDEGGAVVMHLNITAERRAERALRRSEERYRTLIEAARDAVFYIAPDARFTALNAAFEEITGWPREQWLGRRFTELLHPDDLPRVLPHFERTLQGERPPLLEFRVRLKSGGYAVVECIGTPQVRNERVVGVLGIGRDITQRRHLEDQFRQSQKMEAVGRLAGGVAHDFNNMLTIINGYCELLLAQLPQDDALRELIAPIHDAGLRSSRLTRQLLALSRRQILQPRATDLADLVQSVSVLLRRLLGEDVELVTAGDDPLGLVEVDPGQFEQILLNLAVNARDAMPQGGKLTITTHNVKLDQARAATRPSLASGDCVLLTVADTGSGMDAETLTHVFEPFFTTKDRGKGTGLGLATVYGIVQQSNGHIEVDSEPDGGTLFRIYFPRIAAADPERPGAPEPRAGGGTETILLVEDEPVVRLLARRVLRQRGYQLLEAANGCEALTVFADNAERIDLVVSDVIMPQMGGRELVRSLRQSRPDLKVLLISGYTGEAASQPPPPEPGTTFLQKPFTPEALAAKVRAMLDEAAVEQPAV